MEVVVFAGMDWIVVFAVLKRREAENLISKAPSLFVFFRVVQPAEPRFLRRSVEHRFSILIVLFNVPYSASETLFSATKEGGQHAHPTVVDSICLQENSRLGGTNQHLAGSPRVNVAQVIERLLLLGFRFRFLGGKRHVAGHRWGELVFTR